MKRCNHKWPSGRDAWQTRFYCYAIGIHVRYCAICGVQCREIERVKGGK